MDRIVTYVANQQVFAADLNTWQDRTVGLRPGKNNNEHATTMLGLDCVEWQYDTATLANGALVLLDDSRDWRDRVLTVSYSKPTGADQEPGGGNDYVYDYAVTWRRGYTGRGALDAGSVAPTAGNPPVPAAATSWATLVDTGTWLYAHPSSGALYLYNATGSSLRAPILTVIGTAQTGKRP